MKQKPELLSLIDSYSQKEYKRKIINRENTKIN